MALYQFNKLPLVVAIERRDTEVRVVAEIVFWGDVEIGKVAAATPRHKNFFADFVAAVEDQHGLATLGCGKSTEESGSTAANNNHICNFHFCSSAVKAFQRAATVSRPIPSKRAILRSGICWGISTFSSAAVTISSRKK